MGLWDSKLKPYSELQPWVLRGVLPVNLKNEEVLSGVPLSSASSWAMAIQKLVEVCLIAVVLVILLHFGHSKHIVVYGLVAIFPHHFGLQTVKKGSDVRIAAVFQIIFRVSHFQNILSLHLWLICDLIGVYISFSTRVSFCCLQGSGLYSKHCKKAAKYWRSISFSISPLVCTGTGGAQSKLEIGVWWSREPLHNFDDFQSVIRWNWEILRRQQTVTPL